MGRRVQDGIALTILGLRNKTCDMAMHIAGVFATIEEEGEIAGNALQRDISLATCFRSEARRPYEISGISPAVSRAVKLLRCLIDRGEGSISACRTQGRPECLLLR
jgi:hypothetical protein